MEVAGEIGGGKDVCTLLGIAGLIVASEEREEGGREIMVAGELVARRVGDSILELDLCLQWENCPTTQP
jgi:hypothetical protein